MSTIKIKKSVQKQKYLKKCLHFVFVRYIISLLWGVSSAGLERLPVTQKVEGSSPLHPARDFTAAARDFTADKTAVYRDPGPIV